MRRKLVGLIICVLVLVAHPYLSAASSGDTAAPLADSGARVYKDGQLTVELHLSTASLTMAEQLVLALSAAAPEEFELVWPKVEDTMAGFTVAEQKTAEPHLNEEGLLIHDYILRLDPELPGSFTLPSLSVGARRKGQEGGFAGGRVETDPLTVVVRSLLPQGPEAAALDDIAGLVDVPPSLAKRLYLALGILVVILLVLGGWLYWRRKKKHQPPPPPQPAHLKALQRIDQIVAAGLLDRGEVKPFYQQLSDTLRHYIEERFSLRAPEMTTEEFLNRVGSGRGSVAGSGRHFTLERTALLTRFLTHCDLVKFAEYLPVKQEAEETVSLARRFIEETSENPSVEKSQQQLLTDQGGRP